MPGKLHEKVAIVVGASGGIGRATALALHREGARIVLAARSKSKLDEVAEEIQRERGKCCVQPTDVRQEIDVVRLVSRALDAFGGLDIAVCAAGAATIGEVADSKTADWREMAEVNAFAMALLAREAVGVMAEGRGGDLVSISPASRSGRPGEAFVSATKAFSVAFADGLRREMRRRGIRVVSILPAPQIEPGDVADAILFALTRSRRVTIEELVIAPTLDE